MGSEPVNKNTLRQAIRCTIAAAITAVGASASTRGATTLPVPCLGGACANSKFGASGFVSAGQATAVQSGSKLTVNQSTNNVTLNWQSFNISADGKVQFVQPSATSVALNQINDANASQIFGTLNANGRVFLINQNGIIFGAGAQVSVGGLTASTLNIDPAAVTGGLIAPGSAGNPAFQAFTSGVTGNVSVSQGATLQTADGGQILIFAPNVSNQGTISTPGGQTVLAAGYTIYLATSSDPTLRGLLVAVGGAGGTVTNGTAANSAVTSPEQLVGQIVAARGNVTLAGMAVNQLGRISATTSINQNGTIHLQASDDASIAPSNSTGVSGTIQAGTGEGLVLGAHSDTEVTLDSADPSTTVDSVAQPKSAVALTGGNIQILNGSLVRATSGQIDVTAEKASTLGAADALPNSDGSRVYVAPDAELDVSGASIVLPVSSNVIPVQLRGTELANSPLQQNGPLRSQTVYVDIRQGTPLADISGEIAAIGHNVLERNLNGGEITIASQGDAILAPGSVLDVAGGQITYTSGPLNTTQLVTALGQIVGIGSASPNVLYRGIANSATVSDPKWGVSTTYQATPQPIAPGYVEGKDAGSVTLFAPQFVFDASVNASTVAGLYQRQPDQSQALTQALSAGVVYYRPYTQVPQAATLNIGTPDLATAGSPGGNFLVDNLTIGSGYVLPGLLNADGSAFDPLSSEPLPASYTASLLRPELLGTQGFGNVILHTNGKFLDPASVALEFPAGGSFSVTANSIGIGGSIDIPGGTISAAAEPTFTAGTGASLTLGAQASLTARGEWVNDSPLLYPGGNSAPLFINGGAVSLTALSQNFTDSPSVSLTPGSLIDVTGGGQLSSSGALNAGTGGSITIGGLVSGTIAGAPPRLELGATLRGYGLFEGGSLSLTAGTICIAAADCRAGDPTTLWVSPGELASGGFSSYALNAGQGGFSSPGQGGLTVAPGTRVILQQQNLVLPAQYQFLPDQPSLVGLSSTTTLPDQLRLPVNLTLTQALTPLTNNDVSDILGITAATPSLSIGAGALIQADPQATFTLSSNARIIEEGTLRSAGGTINLDLTTNNVPESAYEPTQGIWLGSQGVLDVAGVAQIYPNSIGQRVGSVLSGGTVNVTATRGYIELLPGSLIDVAGSAGVIDVQTGINGASQRAEQVASAGGTVSLTAAEGIQMAGDLRASAGVAGAGIPQPAGGSFNLTLDGNGRGDYSLGNSAFPSVPAFPGDARQIIVSATQPPLVVSPGTPVPDFAAGIADVSAASLSAAGFDSISLKAAALAISNSVSLPGSIDFVGNVSLTAGHSITLDAAAYSVSAGATANVQAPYVLFGNSDQTQLTNYSQALVATPGTGTLNVSGGFIELYGTSALQGIGTAHFTASGDLRVRGLLNLTDASATTLDGSLSMAGDLSLTAQQIYPSTLSQFVLSTDPASVVNPAAGSILVQGSAGTNTDLLSAGGSLTLSAGSVTQNGVLRAPFGNITIDAPTITLGANSLTSTSANGLTIPFGTTQGGLDWVYPLPNGTAKGINLIYGTDGTAPPSQRVTLQGAQVDVKSGAVIDVSGGGDLQAYEFIQGPGGTNDVLSSDPSVGGRPTQFAILPNLNVNVAPYDPNISAGTTLAVGDAVYLSGLPGLAAGVYQLYPSRYALLPGAYLVTQVSGYQDIQSGQAFPQLGGGTVIAGYRTVAGTNFADSRTSGFDVVPASVVLQQAQYTTTGANAFFASQATAAIAAAGAAAANTIAIPRLPQDCGVVALIASDALTLDGTLQTGAASGGLGAEVDVSSSNILVASGTATTQPGQILLTTASLQALDAQTILLGGLRTGDAIQTTAQSVEFAPGTNLTAPQLQVVAQVGITLDGGAQLSAAGTAPAARSDALTGDGAFLSVSAGAQDAVTRSGNAGVTGLLTLAAGSSINAKGGSVYLEATNNVVTDGALSLSGADLAVQSPGIILGSAPAGTIGTVLGPNILGAQGLRNLLLDSGTALSLYGSLNASAQTITLDTPGIFGFGAAGDAVVLTASKTVTLANSQAAAPAGAGTGSGALTITAPDIVFSGGSLAASGLGSVALDATQTVNATADGGFSTGGNLNVTASQITTGSNVQLGLMADGALSLLAPAHPVAATGTLGLGGVLNVTGASIDVATQLLLPSGRVVLTTTGAAPGDPAGGTLTLDSGAIVSVAGVVQQYDGVAAASPGGVVSLTSAGNIALAGGSSIDVSGGSGGQGGTLSISAPGGTVGAGGTLKGTGANGAVFNIDAQQFGDFGALNQLVNAGGFSGGRDVRLRGPGDLIVGAGAANDVTANDVTLEADQGRIVVNGLIDASGTQGGSVTLAAADDLIVQGTVDAHATLGGQRGGTIQLETGAGQLLLNAGSTLDVRGGGTGADGIVAAGGSVLLRAPAATVEAVLSGGTGVAVKGSIVGSSRTTLEAFNVTQNTTGTISSTDMLADPSNPIYAAAMNVVTNAGAIASALGQGSNGVFMVVPGVEIDATVQSNGSGTLTLGSAWNLYQWLNPTFGATGTPLNVPGILTLRAQNGVTFNASLSDGFAATSGSGAFTLPTQPTDSWSYRIVAGADMAAANPLTVDLRNPADVLIAPCGGGTSCKAGATSSRGRPIVYTPNMVRTGDGFIDVSASGDFTLGDQASLLYTAGVANGSGIVLQGRTGSLQGRAYPTNGGDIQIAVGGNVVGASGNDQFVNSWLWRVGSTADASTPQQPGSATAWTVDFQSFQQGIGALGGGNLSVTAGQNITDLAASIPSIGVQVGGTTFPQNVVQVQGGGNLDVSAGGSIFGGTYYVGRGTLALSAGDNVAQSPSTGLAPVIGLGDATVDVTARGNTQVSSVLNPSLLNQGALQGNGSSIVYFSTYGAGSAVNLVAAGGNVVLADDDNAVVSTYSPSFRGAAIVDSANSAILDLFPQALNVTAFGGSIDLSRSIVLSPSTTSGLNLFANQNVVASVINAVGAQLIVSDANPAQLPTPASPARSSGLQIYSDMAAALIGALPDQHAPTPVFAAADQAGTLAPVRVVALDGSVEFQPNQGTQATEGIWSAKPVQVAAGLDVTDLNLVAQNVGTGDVTSVTAGRDIFYPQTRVAGGDVIADTNGIVVDGPGQLQVTAGRNVNLGTSNGLNTRANLLNPALPALGASISVEAGIAAGSPQYASFIKTYIDGSSQFDGELVNFLQAVDGGGTLTAAQAHQAFDALTPELQRTFVEQVYFDLLRTYGRQEAAKGNGDFSGAFAAIQSLFPGANPNLAKGDSNPYSGDIELYFSRIYTEQGGNISLLAPGGQINVGLALAPSSFGITKLPEQLGIVAQTSGSVNAFDYGDFQVNASRVFAADGGDILIWTTEGNIDAGRGAKTAISAPTVNIVYDSNGEPAVSLRAAIAGSGIQALAATPGVSPGDVDLFAPHGVVNANDAGIVAGNLTIAATAVLGAGNITVTGTSVGVPVAVTGLGTAAAGASAAAGATANAAESFNAGSATASNTPLADAAMSYLEVFVTGLGEGNCRPDDVDCLKHERLNQPAH